MDSQVIRQDSALYKDVYDQYLTTLELPDESLFVTDVDLWPIYLDSFSDPAIRQHHNCSACRHFVQRFGGLVTIDRATGTTQSAVWKDGVASEPYANAISTMKAAVESAKVTGVFLSSEKMLGTPVTGEWTHFAVKNLSVYRKSVLTANQAAAEKKEDYRNVSRALGEFDLKTLMQVVELLSGDALYRSEKVLGQAIWLHDLKHATRKEKHQLRKKNIIWKAVADAPAGFCHPRSGMIGTLLDDLDDGVSFDVAARKFKEKMHPLQYQRPSAAPKSGAIAVAEKMVKELGIEKSLERRYATMDDMQTIWLPSEEENGSGGVFDHLKKGDDNSGAVDAGKITWAKFSADVLPKAKKIDAQIPYGLSSYIVFLTALDYDSPVIFQWGNHVSWYLWLAGSSAGQYRLKVGWVKCKAVCFPPYMWGEKNLTHYENNALFILDGAHEMRNEGNALFPETLKSEFHGIRSVIEAHSRKMKVHDVEGEHVVGKGIGSTVRVHTSVVTQYEIDRWD